MTHPKPQYLSVFDLDHTLFRGNSSFHFGVYLYRQKVLSLRAMLSLLRYYLWHKIGAISLPRLHQEVFNRYFKGLSIPFLENHVREFLDKFFDRMLYPPAVEKLNQAKEKKHYTVILSSSPQFLVKRIVDRFEVDEWDSTHYAADEQQCLKEIDRLMEGQDKADYLQALSSRLGIARENIFAYSDSCYDLPLLEVAGTAVGVKPERGLRRICQRKHWQII